MIQEIYTIEEFQKVINKAPKPGNYKDSVIRCLMPYRIPSQLRFIYQPSSPKDMCSFNDITLQKVLRKIGTTSWWDWEFKFNNQVLFWTEKTPSL